MTAYIDIHTHSEQNHNPFAVRNLKIDEAKLFFDAHPESYCSIGIHPWDVHLADTLMLVELEKLAANKMVVAIGECGLDKNSTASIKEQDYYFERQVMLSEKLQKPLIIHVVASFNEIMAMKKRIQPMQAWIIHGFRGKPELAKQLLKMGFILSFGEKFNPLSVEITPLNQLCVETDTSFMKIEDIYQTISGIKACQPSELNAGCHILKLFYC